MGDLYHNSGSDESLALMKGWIDNCQSSHQACKMPQQVGGPKRLAEILDICVASRIGKQMGSLLAPSPSICSGLRKKKMSHSYAVSPEEGGV